MSLPPTVSVVTPSLDQGPFLARAIDSVMDQEIDRLDYLVVDGGSRDSSLDVLKSYGDRIRWISEPDQGQSDAINKGFRQTQGEILSWINADDELAPGALTTVQGLFARYREVDLIYGQGRILDERGRDLGPFSGIEPFSLWRLTHFLDYVLQPAAFFRRSAFEALGGLDRNLHYTMDWDLWIRLAGRGRVLFVDQVLGHSREHDGTKTSTGGLRRVREISRLVRRHSGHRWTPGSKMYLLDTLQRGALRKLPRRLRGPLDAWVHRSMERMVLGVGTFADGWLGPRSAITVPSRWRGFEAEVEIPRIGAQRRVEILVQTPGRRPQVEVAATGGRHVFGCSLPDGTQGPLVTARISVDFSIRPPSDPRELSLRLVRLDPPSTSPVAGLPEGI